MPESNSDVSRCPAAGQLPRPVLPPEIPTVDDAADRRPVTNRPVTKRLGVAAATLMVSLAFCLVGLTVPATSASAAPAIPTAAKHWPRLTYNSSGPAVKYIQQRLQVKPTSGWFGPLTRKAVNKFKKAHQLPADGIWWKRSWRKLGVPYVKPKPAKQAAHPKPGTKAFGAKVIAWAKKEKGKPYVWGAEGPNAFDCSGLAQYVYRHAVDVKLPRVSGDQMRATKRISHAQARPGDLVFVVHSGGYVSHTAIYAGGNMWWEASRPGKPIGLDHAWTSSVVYGRAR